MYNVSHAKKCQYRSVKKRVNVTIPEDYYEEIAHKDLNLSGLITGLLGDHLAGNTITIQVGETTKPALRSSHCKHRL